MDEAHDKLLAAAVEEVENYKRAAEARERAEKLVAKMVLEAERGYDLGKSIGEERHDLISKLSDLRTIAAALKLEA